MPVSQAFVAFIAGAPARRIRRAEGAIACAAPPGGRRTRPSARIAPNRTNPDRPRAQKNHVQRKSTPISINFDALKTYIHCIAMSISTPVNPFYWCRRSSSISPPRRRFSVEIARSGGKPAGARGVTAEPVSGRSGRGNRERRAAIASDRRRRPYCSRAPNPG